MRRAQRVNPSADNKHKTRNDIILAVVLLLAAAASFLWWNSSRAEGAFVAVKIDGKQTAVYSLSEDREVVIETGENRNVMVIRDGTVSVSEANCPDSICVKTRSASLSGETIVCLPHKLVIEVAAEETDSGLDMTA